MHKQSSGWWILALILGLAIAYAMGGALGPLIFKHPAQQKIKTVQPAVAPVVVPSEPQVSTSKPKATKASGDVEVEVIENKPVSKPVVEPPVKPTKPEVSKHELEKTVVKVAKPVVTEKTTKSKVEPERHTTRQPEPEKVAKPHIKTVIVTKPVVKHIVKPIVKIKAKPKVVPPKVTTPVSKPGLVKPKPGLPVQQPTRLDDQTKLPPVTPAAGVYRVLAGSRYKTWAEAQSGLSNIKSHVPGASIIKSSQGGYIVQLAQYRVRQNVNKFTNELKAKGISYTVR